MSSSLFAPPPVTACPPEILQGLDATDADRPAIEVLSAIAWEGPVRDPELMNARDFLALL